MRRPVRIALVALNVLAGLLLASTALLVLLERFSWYEPARALDPRTAFQEGSIGTEFVPLPVFEALPVLFPELFRPGGVDPVETWGFVRRQDGGPLPHGFTVSHLRPLSAAPSPVPFVGIGCAACHTAELRNEDRRLVISGAGNASLDLIAFLEGFRMALLADDSDGRPRLSYAAVRDSLGRSFGPFERVLIEIWIAAARRALTAGTTRNDLPREDPAALRDAAFQPIGPGRTNPFNTLVTMQLGLPNTAHDVARLNHGYTKIPAVFGQGRREWAQFDGSIRDLYARSALAALTLGATSEALAHPQISHNIRAASDYTRNLRPPPFADLVGPGPDGAADAERIARGAVVYARHCASCHGTPTADRSWTQGPRTGEVIPLAEIGTDPERVGLRHARRLAERLHLLFTDAYRDAYNLVHPLATAREDLRPGPAGEVRGYVAQPIEGAFARAPYLHNASVPTLAALVNLEPRPVSVWRGRNTFDAQNVGIAVEEGPAAHLWHRMDTALSGNSAAGHDYPWAFDDPARDEQALRDLVHYLKTL